MGAETKLFHSGMTGAPALTGQAGKLLDVLNACLIDGWGIATVDSVVVASGVATVTRASGHPFVPGSVALIAGATPSGLNGEHKVLTVAGTQYTFATAEADGTATGTITHKVAGAGWTAAFSGTNMRAYQSSDVTSFDMLLRVDDTGTTNARVVGYETMTDVNTGTGPFPTSAQVSGGGYWGKSASADATSRPWVVLADTRSFFLCVSWNATFLGPSTSFSTQFFGDLIPTRTSDIYAAMMACNNSSQVGTSPGSVTNQDVAYVSGSDNPSAWCPRAYHGLGSSSALRRTSVFPQMTGNPAGWSGSATPDWLAFPNPSDTGLYMFPIMVCGDSNYRADMPGAWFIPMKVGASISNGSYTPGSNLLSGRQLFHVGNSQGSLAFDVSGPWR
jgi:hypothetical protein